MVDLYTVLFTLCMEALIPNKFTITMQLPEHQQMYVIKGAIAACSKELSSQRMLACAEDPSFCIDKQEDQ